MKNRLQVRNTIKIQAPLDMVWDALTNPQKTKMYMFGCETVSDWNVGSSLHWKGNYEGKEIIFVKGIVVDIQPNSLLKYTVIDPNAAYSDVPENHLNVTYELSERDGGTELTVIQDGFETAADGAKRYKDVYNNGEGWNPILIQIKKLVEAN